MKKPKNSKPGFLKYLFALTAIALVSLILLKQKSILKVLAITTTSTVTGSLTPRITPEGTVSGWVKDTKYPNVPLDVYVYADGTKDTGKLIAQTLANSPIYDMPTYGFQIKVPTLLDGKAHVVYVYAIDKSTNTKINIPGSPLSFPNEVSSAYYNQPNYPASSGWGADSTNYFDKWKCKSTTGINAIYRLDIASLGKHHNLFWKDSLFVNNTEYSGGAPVVYFTAGINTYIPKFALKKAVYNATLNKWDVSDVLNHPRPQKGGFSSQDGISINDFVMNEYNIPGWGPTANKKGSASNIPGVSETPTASDVPSYPLVGTGQLGITAITNYKQNNTTGYDTCIHMNPTLFNFTNGKPKSMAVYMGTDNSVGVACKLPNGTTLPKAGYYVYNYTDSLGWQLDTKAGYMSNDPTISVINYAYNTDKEFIQADYYGKVKLLNLNKPLATRTETVLDCSATKVYFAEASGTKKSIFFIASTVPSTPENLNLIDIYYAWSTLTK